MFGRNALLVKSQLVLKSSITFAVSPHARAIELVIHFVRSIVLKATSQEPVIEAQEQ